MVFIGILFSGAVLMLMCITGAGAQAQAAEYLSDMPDRLVYSSQGWGQLGMDVSAHARGQSPVPLRIGDKDYAKGLGHHAPGEIVIELDGLYSKFQAEVGVQRQGSNVGSVVFQVLVDGAKKFDSGVMRDSDPPKPVSVRVEGAQELTLAVTDAGDGITCDCANWAEARLIRSTSPKPRKAGDLLDVAQFGRVVTFDPNRTDGCRANRVQEFREEDLFLDTDLAQNADGGYDLPPSGCIGLQWLERRRITELSVAFTDAAHLPSLDAVRVQGWIGESAWQGGWVDMRGKMETDGDRLNFHVIGAENPDFNLGTRKVRWLFPAVPKPVAIRKLAAFTHGRLETAELCFEMENAASGARGEIEMYNGEVAGPSGPVLRMPWDLSSPLRLNIRYIRSRPRQAERTVVRFHLPERELAVAVDDVLANGCVYVRDAGLFVAREPTKVSFEGYRTKAARRKTVLGHVREMPDQTFAQAMEKTHRAAQNNGPTMLSLACDNRKFVVEREGAIRFESHPEDDDRIAVQPLKRSGQVIPRFGSGKNEKLSRHLDGGWLPMPVTTVEDSGIVYRQRTLVAPYGDEDQSAALDWLKQKPLCVAEFTFENPSAKPADASLRLEFLADAEKIQAAEVRQTSNGAVAHSGGRLLAFVDAAEAAPLRMSLEAATVTLSGLLKPKTSARCFAYIPGWEMKADEYAQLTGGSDLSAKVEAYWKGLMASASQIEIPDPGLMNVILASQVHCLIAARNEENGERIAPWIASMSYGPLESESNSIIRGMDFLGHHDFARRSLDYFIHRYNKEGFLTTGYTLMGTGWHLWTLGEHYQLTDDSEWVKQAAPEVDRVCRWIVRQREKTKALDARARKRPEYGLMPPGVIADWNAFAHHFCLNGYYYAGLKAAADALADIGHPGADALLKEASDFRKEIMRAYRWTQARTPALPLKDGSWIPAYPSQVHSPGRLNDFFPGEDGNRSWCYDVEIGAHQLVPQGILPPDSQDVTEMMDHMEDVQFLRDGWFDYPDAESEKDWFDLGGFSKVQPYYCRNAEVYAMRDELKPFIRSYFNALASLLNQENLSFWEHFHASGAWNKTHETGYFLQQTRFMMVMEQGDELWLAPFITNNWMKDGNAVGIRNAPTRFGNVSYRINSFAGRGFIEATIEPFTRTTPKYIVIRLRHPDGKKMKRVTVDGARHEDFDAAKEIVRIEGTRKPVTIRAEY